MAQSFTQEQAARLEEARRRQQQTRDRIESVATNSIMAWLSRVLAPIVRNAVRTVVDWFWKIFG
jgi:hypothetical protein